MEAGPCTSLLPIPPSPGSPGEGIPQHIPHLGDDKSPMRAIHSRHSGVSGGAPESGLGFPSRNFAKSCRAEPHALAWMACSLRPLGAAPVVLIGDKRLSVNSEYRKEEVLYCTQCRCEFEGWTAKCPNCRSPLAMRRESAVSISGEPVSYDGLVDLVRANGGRLSIEMSTVEVARERKGSFPYHGYGRAWAKRLQGTFSNVLADLITTEVGRDRAKRFPYRGYGFAWANRVQGTIGGNDVDLKVSKVKRQMKRRFPYFGYGYAWTEEMSGQCGHMLKADLVTTDVGTHRAWRFPHSGHGYAWAKRATLTLTLKD